MSLSEVMLKTLIPSNFLDSDDEEIKSLTCPPETDELQKNEFHMFNDYFGLSNLVQKVTMANDFDYLSSNGFGKMPSRRDRYDSIDSENSSSGSCDSFTDHGLTFADGPFQPFGTSSFLHGSAPGKRKEAMLPPSRRGKPMARATMPSANRQVCVFCRNNGESEDVYASHVLKGPEGKTTCPILRAYTCPICKASGDESHTIKYCPQNQQTQGNGSQLPKVPRSRVLPKRSR